MLFSYRYINHSMEKMQDYIDYIFLAVWCEAPKNPDYGIDLFDKNSDLKQIVKDFFYSDRETKGKTFFLKKIEVIYECFKELSDSEIARLKAWYQANNNIEALCNNNPTTIPISYKELSAFHNELTEQLQLFFKQLYSKDLLSLKPIESKIGTVNDHCKQFMKANSKGVCPYCGIQAMKGAHHTKREAYDHYIPKGVYPFNSINFKNLAPMCNECNSSYKLSKDPLYDDKKSRRKSFYSYMLADPAIEIELELKNPIIEKLIPEEIELNIQSNKYPEEVQVWKELFGIEERYKAKCLAESGGSWWYRQHIIMAQHSKISATDYLDLIQNLAKTDPFMDAQFLKIPFLKACEKVGAFDAVIK